MEFFSTPEQAGAGGWRLDHSYARLPEILYRRDQPVPVRAPRLLLFNESLARRLGLDPGVLQQEENADWWTGNRLPPGASALAQAYAGHQFGHQTMLGDGRAHLLGEQIAPDGSRWDVQLKGSGRSGFSRRGDGRAALGPMLREFIISEAMHGLGIPTTRSLAVAATGETVFREDPLPGAVLTRIAASHIRVGTFEYAAAAGEPELVHLLVDYTLARHYPEAEKRASPALTLLHEVMRRQADLVAQWMGVGFVHGVMNTDNMALSGETIDYGPCAFLDRYDPATVFSSIDRHGRYAYDQQPGIALWNLTRLAEALLPCWGDQRKPAVAALEEVLGQFEAHYQDAWLAVWRKKLGLEGAESGDGELIRQFLATMHQLEADFTQTCRSLADWVGASPNEIPEGWQTWHEHWTARRHSNSTDQEEPRTKLEAANPARIPRNHVVEAALRAAMDEETLEPAQELVRGVREPFARKEGGSDLEAPPPTGQPRYVTFCGT